MYKISDTVEADDRTRFFCKCDGRSTEMDKFEVIWEEGVAEVITARYMCYNCGKVIQVRTIIRITDSGWTAIDQGSGKF